MGEIPDRSFVRCGPNPSPSSVDHVCGTSHSPIADHNTTIDRQILIEVNMTNVEPTPVAQAFADGSIMPRVTTGNTMAPCVIIGERATDILAAQHTL
jgi:hypothetical protein